MRVLGESLESLETPTDDCAPFCRCITTKYRKNPHVPRVCSADRSCGLKSIDASARSSAKKTDDFSAVDYTCTISAFFAVYGLLAWGDDMFISSRGPDLNPTGVDFGAFAHTL
jgi:hypothetical protein